MIYPLIVITSVLACSLNGVPTGGYYNPANGEIHICQTATKQEQKSYIAHEYAHKIWFEKFTQEDRDTWRFAWGIYLHENYPGQISLYEHTNPGCEEDFAIMIQQYVQMKGIWSPHQELIDLFLSLIK